MLHDWYVCFELYFWHHCRKPPQNFWLRFSAQQYVLQPLQTGRRYDIPLLLLALLPYQYLETPDVFGYVSLLGYNILIFGAWFLFFGIGILPFCHYVGLGLGYVAGKVIRKPS